MIIIGQIGEIIGEAAEVVANADFEVLADVAVKRRQETGVR